MTSQVAVLGIDAAWTEKEPSGVALWAQQGNSWSCLKVAPSYSAFCNDFSWEEPVVGGKADVPTIIATCKNLLGHDNLVVAAVDMPLSVLPITQRRAADDLVSKFDLSS